MATLDLSQGVRSSIFRLIVKQITNDSTIQNTFNTLLSWDGSDADRVAVGSSMCPVLRLTPIPSGMQWYSPDSQYGDLQIKVQMYLLGVDADDPLNLWEAIETAIYPINTTARESFRTALMDAGAQTGQIEFTLPAFDNIEGPEQERMWNCVGNMRLSLIRILTP